MDQSSTPKTETLILQAVRDGFFRELIVAVALFSSARTFNFPLAWAFLLLESAVIAWSYTYLYRRHPELLARRLIRKEKIVAQRWLIGLWRIFAIAVLVVAGLDRRLDWSGAFLESVPLWLSLTSLSLVLGGHILVLEAMKANSYAASVIQIESGQTVVATGPYRLVRHPMYLGFAVTWLFTPLALGSFIASPITALIMLSIVFRLLNEEKLLHRDLPDYAGFCKTTRYRLVPFVW